MTRRKFLTDAFPVLGLILMACETPATSDDGDRAHVRVALCQIEVDSKPEVNFGRIEAALAEAGRHGAEIACFPEACIFGWVNSDAHAAAAEIPGATTDRIGAIAKRLGVMVMLGLAERDGDRLFNSAVLIDVDGRLLLRHRKVNILDGLMEPPSPPGPGAEDSVADTRFGRIGLLICADTFKEPLVEQVAKQAPDLVLVPYGWAAPADKWPDHGKSLCAWITRTARQCGAPVVGVDSTGEIHRGPWRGQVLGGQSVVCDAAGRVIEVLPDRVPAVRVHDIDSDARPDGRSLTHGFSSRRYPGTRRGVRIRP